MSFENFIFLRYLRAKKSFFLSFLSFLALTGIFLSVFSFLVIHSVMNGFSNHMRKAIIGFNADLTYQTSSDTNEINDWVKMKYPESEIYSVTDFDGIFEISSGESAGVKVRGMDPKNFTFKTTYFGDESLDSLKPHEDQLPGVIIGEELYNRYSFLFGQTETLSLYFPFGSVNPMGEIEPNIREFRVIGVFTANFYDFDNFYVFIDQDQSHWLTSADKSYDKNLIFLPKKYSSKMLKDELVEKFASITVETWEQNNKRLLSALKLEKIGMMILLVLVVGMASFNIFAFMTLLTIRKSKEMAVFYSLGASLPVIKRIFKKLSLSLGLMGTLLGIVCAFATVYWLTVKPIELPMAYYLQNLPIEFDFKMMTMLLIITPLFCLLISIIPLEKIGRMRPMEIFREN